MNAKLTRYFIIGTFVTLYLLVSCISTIHVIDFFKLSNPTWLAVSLAVAFEIGAAASLASLITLDKMNKGIVWSLFVILTLMQAMGNAYYAYVHLNGFQGWIELFGLIDEELIYQKRFLSIVSGAILPIVALGFIKSLVDYIKPESEEPVVVPEIPEDAIKLDTKTADNVQSTVEKTKKELTKEESQIDGSNYESVKPVEQSVAKINNRQVFQIDNHESVDSRLARGRAR